MTGLLIRGGRVVDPAAGLDAVRDVRVRDGAIAEIGIGLQLVGETLIEVRDAIVAPGFIDMHVHLREPGFEEKETIATGTTAAVRGGFTAVACMPNTRPALDDPAVIAGLLRTVERDARSRVYPVGAITRGRRGEVLCDFAGLARAGAVAFSDDGDTVESERLMTEAANLARDLRPPFIAHSIPEEPIVERDLRIAAETKKGWHIAHVSTAATLDLLRASRARGVHVTCEVTPHHLTFTNALVAQLGPAATVNPPLRGDGDVRALRNAVYDGTVDAFASDHAPHREEEKKRSSAAPGFTGLEIAVGAYAAALPDLPLLRFVELISTNPARILGLRGGRLMVGDPADVTIFGERAWRVDPAYFASKGTCTPFAGQTLPRKVLATIVGGDVRYRAEDLAA
jgi:dihydroorotase